MQGADVDKNTHTVKSVGWIARLWVVWLITETAVAQPVKKRRRGQQRKTAVARTAEPNLFNAERVPCPAKGSMAYIAEDSMVLRRIKE